MSGGRRRCGRLSTVDNECHKRGESVRVDDVTGIKRAVESILLGATWVVGYLDPTRSPRGVVIDVEVRCLVEAMEDWSNCRWCEVVVDIGIAEVSVMDIVAAEDKAYTVTSLSSPGNGGIADVSQQYRSLLDDSWARGDRNCCGTAVMFCGYATAVSRLPVSSLL
jgi:hypothetical protein